MQSQSSLKVNIYDIEGKQHYGYLWYADDTTIVISKKMEFTYQEEAFNYAHINRITLNREKRKNRFWRGMAHGVILAAIPAGITGLIVMYGAITYVYYAPVIAPITGYFYWKYPILHKIDYNTYNNKDSFAIIVPYLKDNAKVETIDKSYKYYSPTTTSIQTEIPSKRWHPLRQKIFTLSAEIEKRKYFFAYQITDNIQDEGIVINSYENATVMRLHLSLEAKIYPKINFFYKARYNYDSGQDIYISANDRLQEISVGMGFYMTSDVKFGLKYYFNKINRIFLNNKNIYFAAAINRLKIENYYFALHSEQFNNIASDIFSNTYDTYGINIAGAQNIISHVNFLSLLKQM